MPAIAHACSCTLQGNNNSIWVMLVIHKMISLKVNQNEN